MNDSTSSDVQIDHVPTQEGYDRWSESYDVDENPLVAIEEPWVKRLLGDVRGLSVLDVGCGTGRHALWMANAGAEVTAIDFSAGMLQRAINKCGGRNIRFQVQDLSQPLPFEDLSFDRVLCGLVIDHIADLGSLFREMTRICRPKGVVLVSVMHPAMMLLGVSARFRDPASGREIRPGSCTHQISDYVMAAAQAGLSFDHLSEHTIDEELANRSERARKYLNWPILFLMRLSPTAVVRT